MLASVWGVGGERKVLAVKKTEEDHGSKSVHVSRRGSTSREQREM